MKQNNKTRLFPMALLLLGWTASPMATTHLEPVAPLSSGYGSWGSYAVLQQTVKQQWDLSGMKMDGLWSWHSEVRRVNGRFLFAE